MKRLGEFLKKEAVLTAAVLLAALSAVVIPPDREYMGYMDFRTLAILFSLMAVMAGLGKCGLFAWLARRLLARVKTVRQTALILILLCFCFSMFITNDVALITFVPFTFIVLNLLGEQEKKDWLVFTVAMQTVAANLGSMLTPIGNPQNLYLYGRAGIRFGEFVLFMLPYTLLSLALLLLWIAAKRGNHAIAVSFSGAEAPLEKKQIFVYTILFLVCLLCVVRILPWPIMLAAVVLALLVWDRGVFRKVDYSLLLTFTGFFIFIGNMGRVMPFRIFLEQIVTGREVIVSVIASQVISNVPAALLLSGFTDQVKALMIGTNLGGLGTLIASMASLISFKYLAREEKDAKGRYLLYFTGVNILFLAVLLMAYRIMHI